MDTRLTFRDYGSPIKTDAGTQRVNPSAQWFQGGGEARLGWGNPPGRLPGKSAKEGFRIRTTNRHRWTRRKFSGARVMACSGTRQISSVTSGKGVPSSLKKMEAAVNSVRRLFNKNTGLCKVENDV